MHEPKIVLQPRKRVRYLKLIALFKIFKGVLLFLLGFSLLFLNGRPVWLDQISDWADDQLLLAHSKYVIFLLNKFKTCSPAARCAQLEFSRFFIVRCFLPKVSAFTCKN